MILTQRTEAGPGQSMFARRQNREKWLLRLEALQMLRRTASPLLQTAGVSNPFSKHSSKIYNYVLCREGEGEQTIRLVYGTTRSKVPTQALPPASRRILRGPDAEAWRFPDAVCPVITLSNYVHSQQSYN